MRQRNARHITSKHPAQLCRTIASRIHHIFRSDRAIWRRDHPFILNPLDSRHRTKTDNLLRQGRAPFGQRLGQLRRIYIPIKRVPLPTVKIMRFQKRVNILHFTIGHFLKFDTHLTPHRLNMAKFFHALAAMCQPDCPVT